MFRKTNRVSANSRINRLSKTSAVSQLPQTSPPEVGPSRFDDVSNPSHSCFKPGNEVGANDPRQQNLFVPNRGVSGCSTINNNSLEACFAKQGPAYPGGQHPYVGFDRVGAGLGASAFGSGRRIGPVPIGDPLAVAEAGLRSSSSISLPPSRPVDTGNGVGGSLDDLPWQYPNKVWIRSEVETAAVKRPRLGASPEISRRVEHRVAPRQVSQWAAPTSTPTTMTSSTTMACICDRPTTKVCCAACGHLENGLRVRRGCPLHPNIIYLMDLSECPNCKGPSSYLKEFSFEHYL